MPKPPRDPNLRVIKLWHWDDFRWYGVHQGLCDPKGATDLFLRGYYTAQAHREEVKSAMSWMFREDAASNSDESMGDRESVVTDILSPPASPSPSFRTLEPTIESSPTGEFESLDN